MRGNKIGIAHVDLDALVGIWLGHGLQEGGERGDGEVKKELATEEEVQPRPAEKNEGEGREREREEERRTRENKKKQAKLSEKVKREKRKENSGWSVQEEGKKREGDNQTITSQAIIDQKPHFHPHLTNDLWSQSTTFQRKSSE